MRPIPRNHNRRSIRLRGYDYSSPGFYFVTVCTTNREMLFGRIEEGEMKPEATGQAVLKAWHTLPQHFSALGLDAFVIMPNHVHGIIRIAEAVGVAIAVPRGVGVGLAPSNIVGAGLALPRAQQAAPLRQAALGDIMRAFKSASAISINRLLGRSGCPVWQRNYYERVVRDEKELLQAREYIAQNPLRWELDRENPTAHQAGDESDLPWET